MKIDIYNQEGKAVGEMTLPKDIFGVEFNADLVHQISVCGRMKHSRLPWLSLRRLLPPDISWWQGHWTRKRIQIHRQSKIAVTSLTKGESIITFKLLALKKRRVLFF